MSPGWLDARGCLTAEGMAALQSAVPGAAPPELASHLSACARCQQRLLSVESGARPAARERREGSSPWKNLAVVGMALLLLMLGMLVTAYVAG